MGQTRNAADGVRRGRPTAEQAAAISRSILLVATRLFLEAGYEGTSMGAVAKLANVPRSTLYKRYEDKRALLRDVIALRIAEWSRVAQRKNHRLTGSLAERLEFHVGSCLVWGTHPEISAVNQLAQHAWPAAGEGQLRVLDISGMTETLANEIRQFAPSSGLRIKDPDRIAEAIMMMIAGWLTLNWRGGQISEDEATHAARFMVTVICNGAAALPRPTAGL